MTATLLSCPALIVNIRDHFTSARLSKNQASTLGLYNNILCYWFWQCCKLSFYC